MKQLNPFQMYCVECEELVHTTTDDEGTFHVIYRSNMSFELCEGFFTFSSPPELPEHWEELVTEPTAEELAQMDLNAQEILLDVGV